MRARRAFISSSESLRDWIWPESWSLLAEEASCEFCIWSLRPATTTDILLTESAFCWTRSFITPMRSSLACCRRATASRSCCICAWS
jgi:hypothetical protein